MRYLSDAMWDLWDGSKKWYTGCPAHSVAKTSISEDIDGLVQDCSDYIANALELLQSCTKH